MARFTTHREGGSWLGGGVDVTDCSGPQITAINNAFNNFINSSCLNCFPGLRDCLQRTFETIEIDCTGSECDNVSGSASGGKIWICDTSPGQVGPVLLHELVHVCGGGELDAVAVENNCFFGNGALDPAVEWDTIRSGTGAFGGNQDIRVGRWVTWNTLTGQVWGGNTTSGGPCFQRNNWIHRYPSGGGWI